MVARIAVRGDEGIVFQAWTAARIASTTDVLAALVTLREVARGGEDSPTLALR